MRPFPVSFGFVDIRLAIDYVSKLVEAKATRTNDAKVVVDFVRSNLFCRFGVPRAIVSDQGTHFCNRSMYALLKKYGVRQGRNTHKQRTTQQSKASQIPTQLLLRVDDSRH